MPLVVLEGQGGVRSRMSLPCELRRAPIAAKPMSSREAYSPCSTTHMASHASTADLIFLAAMQEGMFMLYMWVAT